jgi:hypothetical protein
MRGPTYVECGIETLPDVEGIALVASVGTVKFVPAAVERAPDGTSWRSLVLVREGFPEQRIGIRIVAQHPQVLEVRFDTDAECGPVAFYLAMETQGRTLSQLP